MLVLSREKHEAIVFSTPQGEVIVEVVEVRGDKVRLGIKCDKDIPVHRKESFDAIQQEIDDKDNDNECMTELTEDEQHIADLLSEACGGTVKTTPLDGRMRAGGLNRLRDERLHVVGGTVHLIDEVSTHPPSHLELLMGAINNLTDQRCIDDVVVDGEGAVITTDDGVTKQNWDIKPTELDRGR